MADQLETVSSSNGQVPELDAVQPRRPNRGPNASRETCPQGHAYADGYQYAGKRTNRKCKACTVARVYARRARLGRVEAG